MQQKNYFVEFKTPRSNRKASPFLERLNKFVPNILTLKEKIGVPRALSYHIITTTHFTMVFYHL